MSQPPDFKEKPANPPAVLGWSFFNRILLGVIVLALLTEVVMRWNDGSWPFAGTGDEIPQQSTILKNEQPNQTIGQFNTARPANQQKTATPSRPPQKLHNKIQDRIPSGSGAEPVQHPTRQNNAAPQQQDQNNKKKIKKTIVDRMPAEPRWWPPPKAD